MKRFIKIVLLAVMAVAFMGQADAQTARQRMTREQLAETQANNIAKRMNFNGDVKEKFVNTYCQFQKELWAIGPRARRGGNGGDKRDAGEVLEDRFERSQKILDLRKEYYKKYSEFLSQDQIARVYKIEKQMMNRLKARKQGKPRR